MSFWQKALIKTSAILKAAFALAVFLCIEYSAVYIIDLLHIDRNIYRGSCNFIICVLMFAAMFAFHKFSSRKNDPLIKIGKFGPDQVVALVVISLGMLGLVVTYLAIANKISEYFKPLDQEITNYRESVNRFAKTPQTIIPLWDTLLYVFTLSFLVPLTEEMAFRGVVFGELRKAFRPWIAVILSAIGFGVMHGLSVHIGYALACGIIIAACYYLTDSLIAPIILHVIFNVLGSALPTFLAIERLGIPKEFSSGLMVWINTVSTLFMPVSVLAMAYLISVKRKKDKEAAALKETAVSAETVQSGDVQDSDPVTAGDSGAKE